MSPRRICALSLKEMQDLRRNGSILSMLAVPLLMTFLWSGPLNMAPEPSFTIGTLFSVVMIGVYTPAMLLSEEKEKHTLKVLMLSPATPLEILISKGLVTFLCILLVTLLLIPISSASVQNYLLLTLILVLGSAFVILLGFIIGLLAPNQMATGYIGMPVYLLLLLLPMLGQQNAALARLAKFVPSNYIGDGVYRALHGQAMAAAGREFLALGVASIVLLGLFVLLYRRHELSD